MTRFAVTAVRRAGSGRIIGDDPIEVEADFCEIEDGCAIFTVGTSQEGEQTDARDLTVAIAAGYWSDVRVVKRNEDVP